MNGKSVLIGTEKQIGVDANRAYIGYYYWPQIGEYRVWCADPTGNRDERNGLYRMLFTAFIFPVDERPLYGNERVANQQS